MPLQYLARFLTRRTPQRKPIPSSDQVRNSAGGYVWAVDDWTRLDRFITLGSEAGTYYIGERQLTRENAEATLRCIRADGVRVVDRIVEISQAGRAPKNDPAIFALALACAEGDEATKRAAFAALPRVCRIGTHLFHFAAYVEGFRGWGRGLRTAVAGWYGSHAADDLAFEVIKYGQRDGWSHRDLLRLAHPRATDSVANAVYHWVTKGWEWVGDEPHPDPVLRLLWAAERAKRATSKAEIVRLIREQRLPREAIPTQWLGEAEVWEALLSEMPLTAMIRNLATMTRVGLLKPGGETTALVVARLGDPDRLRRAQVHPINVLAALKTYAQGQGERGQHHWQPLTAIVDALDGAFYASFGNVRPTGQRILLGLDVSGSMAGTKVNGIPGLEARVACGALALVHAAVEPRCQIVAFDAKQQPIAISARQRLDDVVKALGQIGGGGTDCAVPITVATESDLQVDAFVILTDSETWAGQTHPRQALEAYRQKSGLPAKLVTVAMASNRFSLADPNDAGMLNVVGFDSATPNLIGEFIAGAHPAAAPAA